MAKVGDQRFVPFSLDTPSVAEIGMLRYNSLGAASLLRLPSPKTGSTCFDRSVSKMNHLLMSENEESNVNYYNGSQ